MRICKVCKKEFKEHLGDIYCSKLCLMSSISNEEYENALIKFTNAQNNCTICRKDKKFLVHKRMNGQWFLWQECHYENNTTSVLGCYYCNLWEKTYRKRTGKILTMKEHQEIIKRAQNDN